MPVMESQLFSVAFAWLNRAIFQNQTHTKQYKWKGDSRIPTLSHSQARSFWEKSGDLSFFIIVCWDRFPLAYIHRVISLVIWKATSRLRVVCNFGEEYESGQNARTRARLLESPSLARARVLRPLTYLQSKLATTGTQVDSHRMDRSTGGALHQNRRGQGSNPVLGPVSRKSRNFSGDKNPFVPSIATRFVLWNFAVILSFLLSESY